MEERFKFAVTAIDIGDTSNGHARLVGLFKSYDDAHTYVVEDMKDTLACMGQDENTTVDWNKFEIFADKDKNSGCIWDIHNVKDVEIVGEEDGK